MKTSSILWLNFLLTMSALVSHHAYSQSSSFGGTLTDIPYCINKTNDMGYIVIGQSNSTDGDVSGNKGQADYWVVKLDNNLDTLWTKTFGGSASDIGRFIHQTVDGGFICAGWTSSNDFDVSGNHGGLDYWILKLNNTGGIEWSKSLGGSNTETATSINQTIDGSYIISGSSRSTNGDVTGNHGGIDFWIVKLNSNGEIIWQKSLGGTSDEPAHSAQQTTDGGYIVSGHTYSNDGDVTGFQGISDYWIVKIDENGNITWAKTYGGTDKEFEPKTLQTPDGGYIVAGSTKSNNGDVWGHHGNYDYWILKLDSNGDTIWTRTLGGSADDIAHAVSLSSDGYVIAGETQSNDGDVIGNHGGKDYWIVKLSLNGDKIWTKTFGGSLNELGNSVVVNANSEFVLAGSSSSNDGDVSGNHGIEDYWIVKDSIQSSIMLDIKVFLEGAYDNGQMTPLLNAFLPLTQPYSASPWNYNGLESVTAIPSSNIADWVLVDLLTSGEQSDTYNFLGRKAAFLMQDGSIRDLDAVSNLAVPTVLTGDYYVRIHHRNHLSVMAANPATDNTGVYKYDFTTSSSQALGGNNTQKELSPGIWGMIAADGNASGEVDNRDKNDVWDPQYGQVGYLNGDFNLNSEVDIYDKTDKWEINAGKGITDLQYWVSSNLPPEPPSNPQPSDGSIDVGIETSLSWFCIDPDGDALTYSIYFGSEINPPIIESKYTFSYYSLPVLESLTTYYWKIVALDIHSDSANSAIWSFTTLSNMPTLITAALTNITSTTATGGGEVTYDGGANVTEKGVCWSISQNPTISDSHTSDGTGIGIFESNITDLSPNTLYYVRAFATNNIATGYGNEVTFTTLPNPNLPVVITTAVSNVTQTTATSGGNVISDGGYPVVFRGVCWSISPYPTIVDSKTVDGSGMGAFVSNITGLTANTSYYVRAYAVNTMGSSYGNEHTFITLTIPPTVTTNIVTNITTTSAICGGDVTSDGGVGVTERGVCWSIASNPTIADNFTTDGSGTGVFISNITGLTPNTFYFVRAYATNNGGTAYGNEVTFTTLSLAIPTVLTTYASNITQTTATCGGDVTSDGGAAVTVRGVCWSLNPNPTISADHTLDGAGTGEFVSNLIGLTPNTLYYVRAYATNSIGTAYGNEVTFATLVPVIPTIETAPITNITQTTATSGGNVVSDGGATLTARGVCWNTSPNPTTANSKTIDGSGTGAFVSNISGLTVNTTYYVRAYATNNIGTAYGEELTFTTLSAGLPTLVTTAITNITQTTAIGGGNIISDGGATIIFRGVCWNTSPDPTTSNSKTVDGSGTGAFVSNITGLIPNTLYYVRAYAVNNMGTSYGNEFVFLTFAVITTEVTNISQTTATSGGNVNGVSGVTSRGVCWNTSPTPTTSNYKTVNGSGTGSYVSNITGLNQNTTYYIRAYAVHSLGTSYGNELSFTTLLAIPSVTTNAVTNITPTTATCGGNVTSQGGSAVTARGVCWNTSPNPTTANNKTIDGSGIGSFISYLTELTTNTTYYIRAYATNSGGTAYGNEMTFGTIIIPTITTNEVTNITPFTATCGGNVTSQGGATVTARGVCWNTSPNPTTANNKTIDGSGIGSFVSNLTGLTTNTTYYIRAYATNGGGTAYGDEMTFNTLSDQIFLTTTPLINLLDYTAISGGNIISDGGSAIIFRGVCWSTNPNPTIVDFKTVDGVGIGVFVSKINGLTPNTLYYLRAYAMSDIGIGYGNEESFTTSVDLTCPGMTTISYGENIYYTLKYGTQCWLRENLNIGTMINSSSSQTNNSIIEKYCYNNDPTNCTTYGGLYQWNEMMQYVTTAGTKGICPDGWYLPTAADWTNLTTYLGGESVAGGKMKEAGTTHWNIPNTGATNSCGFTALPAGQFDGSYFNIQYLGWFWSSSLYTSSYAHYSRLSWENDDILNAHNYILSKSLSVRCVKSVVPVVSTNAITDITAYSALGGGDVIDEGTTDVTARGVCWSTDQNPTIDDPHTFDGSGIGSYTSQIIGLTPNTYYYVRAYATNIAGTTYGNTMTFTTSSNLTVTTEGVSNVTTFTATSGGIVTSDGAEVTARGVCWSTSANPTLANSHTTDGSGTGTFVSDITGLSANSNYYVRAYATSIGITTYGNQLSFSTPLIYTYPVTNITQTTATCNRDVGNMAAGMPLVESGICWSSSGYPTIENSTATDNNITGLMPSTIYYVRAYGIYEDNWFNPFVYYGNAVEFMTLGYILPIVITNNISNIDFTTATGGGDVINEGNSAVTIRGICWSTNENPTIDDQHTVDGAGLGSFVSNLIGLIPETSYYVRAYATNSEGTAYGNQVTFSTNITCGDVLSYGGQNYNTVQIGLQCWLKENLNIGTMINSSSNQTNNSVIEKYCYNNDPANCAIYGGLYQWNEMMQYITTEGTEGICPGGWHLPSDAQWYQMENYIDPTINNPSSTGWRGADGGTKLQLGGLSGLNVKLAGMRFYNSGAFSNLEDRGYFWTSTSGAYYRRFDQSNPQIYRASNSNLGYGFSVRCLKD